MGPPVVEERRTFLAWAINGLGAIFAVIFGFPVVCYLIDPRHREGPKGDFKLADGVRVGELTTERPIVQGVIRDVRRDAYTLHPNDVLGRIWVVLQPGKVVPLDASARRALKSGPAAPLKVFTTICPHLGCSVNLAGDGTFLCPCHAASFERDGQRLHPEHNPAQRGMDELAWEVDPNDVDGNRLLVKYRNFKSSVAEKVELA
jgi:Rieske Fe-S protein